MAEEITSDIQNPTLRQKTLLLAMAIKTDVVITMNAGSCHSGFT
jgi:hypothetical protein